VKKRRTREAMGGGTVKNWAAHTQEKRVRCTECKNTTSIFRHPKDKKAKGHIKHMYCYHCKRITKHIEVGNA
jgi:ribosomal protein S27E